MGATKGEVKGLGTLGMFVQQVAQVGCGGVCGGDG